MTKTNDKTPDIKRTVATPQTYIGKSNYPPEHNGAEDNGINLQVILFTAVLSLQTLTLRNLTSASDIRVGKMDIC